MNSVEEHIEFSIETVNSKIEQLNKKKSKKGAYDNGYKVNEEQSPGLS